MKKSTFLKFLEVLKSNFSCCLYSKSTISKQEFRNSIDHLGTLGNSKRSLLRFAMIMILIFTGFTSWSQTGGSLPTIDGSPAEWPAVLSNSAITIKVNQIDEQNSSLDDIWTQGSQDVDPISGWNWTNNSANDKNDMKNTGAILVKVSVGSGIHNVLYFFADRFANNGDSDLGIWFMLNSVLKNATPTGFSGVHENGDILLRSHFVNGGGIAERGVFVWTGKTATLPGGLVEANLSVNNLNFISNPNNGTVVPSPWVYSPKSGTAGTYPKNSFVEGFLDLDALASDLGISVNLCFSSFLIETGNSQSVNSSLEDLVSGKFGSTPEVSVADLVKCEGDAVATFSTANLGTGYTYQWKYATKAAPTVFITIDGAMNYNYDTGTVNLSMDGYIYKVVVTSTVTGCSAEDVGTLTVNPKTTASDLSPATRCVDGADVTFTTTAGGTVPLTYVWKKGTEVITGATTNSFTVVGPITLAQAGTYTVEVTGACGKVSKSATLTVNPNSTADAGSDEAKCQPKPSGPTPFTLAGTATNGTTLWTVFAKTGTADATFGDATSLTSSVSVSGTGTVTLRLTTTSTFTPSCKTATDDVVLTVNPNPEIVCPDPLSTNTVCGADAKTTQDLANASFATWFAQAPVSDADYLVTAKYVYSPVAATPSPEGTAPLILTFTNPSTKITSVTVIWTIKNRTTGCENSCSSVFTLEYGCAISCNTVVTNLTCNGDKSGAIKVIAQGGTLPYIIYLYKSPDFINPIADSETLNSEPGVFTFLNLAAGDYRTESTDVLNLKGSGTRCDATVTEPKAVALEISNTNVSCFGKADGTLSIVSSDGTGTPTFSLSSDGTNFNATTEKDLESAIYGPGTYYIKVSYPDGNTGTTTCDLTKSTTIKEPTLVSIKISGTNVTCTGKGDGTLSIVNYSGGDYPTFSLKKDDGAFVVMTKDEIEAGSYGPGTYIIKIDFPDGNNPPGYGICSSAQDKVIIEPSQVNLAISSTNVTCNGAANGKLSIDSYSGTGTPVFSLSTDGGTTFNEMSEGTIEAGTYGPGTYIIMVSYPDGNNPPGSGTCSDTKSTTITEPDKLDLALTSTGATCFGSDNGSISAEITGTPWSDLQISLDNSGIWAAVTGTPVVFKGLTSGSHNVALRRISDNTCTTSKDASVTQPDKLDLVLTPKSTSCEGVQDGSISAVVTGTPLSDLEINVDSGAFADVAASPVVFSGLAAGDHTIVLQRKSDNNCSVTMKSTVGSNVCAKALCTYTQGAYGNSGGKYCDGINGNLSTSALISQAINNAPNKTITVGSPGHSVIITSSDVDCVISRLPGGGPAKELSAGDISICSSSIPLKNGRINNVLLAQTITLALNINIKGTSDLANFALQASTLATAAPEGGCGNDVAKTRVCGHCENDVWMPTVNEYTYRSFSAAVIAALKEKTVAGLLDLANRALANSDGAKNKEEGVSLSDIASAVASVNEVFDGCRISMGWEQVKCPVETLCPDLTSTTARIETTETSNGLVKVYPNPFKDHLTFEITADVSGNASLQIYNLLGQKVADLFNGYLEAGTTKSVEYFSPTRVNQTALIYLYKLGNTTYTGKLQISQ